MKKFGFWINQNTKTTIIQCVLSSQIFIIIKSYKNKLSFSCISDVVLKDFSEMIWAEISWICRIREFKKRMNFHCFLFALVFLKASRCVSGFTGPNI
jgi:FlaA1/EpsC-like NDP-sugar epimerase